MNEHDTRNDATRQTVRNAYADIATGRAGGCCGPKASCCGSPDPNALAQDIGYSEEELAGLPEGANMGLSCGNPTALASLKPGEVVLDLGSGGGFDVFIAARTVGPSGRAIGVDMTAEMVAKARRNAATFQEQTGLANVEFRLGEIEHLPVADASVDVVISNCVINLSPDKPQVWREIARVLKPGGRVSVSDVALLRPLPDAVHESVKALVGCVAGAALVDDTREMIRAAGLVEDSRESKPDHIDGMAEWSDPMYRNAAGNFPPTTKPSDFITSLTIQASKRTAGTAPQDRGSASEAGKPANGASAGLDGGAAELVAIGASVAGHCQPCLVYHLAKARELGVADALIQEAITVGRMVERGAMSAMREFAKGAVGASTQSAPACCGGAPSQGGKNCCG